MKIDQDSMITYSVYLQWRYIKETSGFGDWITWRVEEGVKGLQVEGGLFVVVILTLRASASILIGYTQTPMD